MTQNVLHWQGPLATHGLLTKAPKVRSRAETSFTLRVILEKRLLLEQTENCQTQLACFRDENTEREDAGQRSQGWKKRPV